MKNIANNVRFESKERYDFLWWFICAPCFSYVSHLS